MDDLISRKALIAEYDRVHIGEPGKARKLMEDATAVQKWIPVTERLPDKFEQFLCSVIRPIRGGKYVREYRVLWCDYDHSWNCDELIVTHWMPLPELPKGE